MIQVKQENKQEQEQAMAVVSWTVRPLWADRTQLMAINNQVMRKRASNLIAPRASSRSSQDETGQTMKIPRGKQLAYRKARCLTAACQASCVNTFDRQVKKHKLVEEEPRTVF